MSDDTSIDQPASSPPRWLTGSRFAAPISTILLAPVLYFFVVREAAWQSVRAQGCSANDLEAGGMFSLTFAYLAVVALMSVVTVIVISFRAPHGSSHQAIWGRAALMLFALVILATLIAVVVPRLIIPDDYCQPYGS